MLTKSVRTNVRHSRYKSADGSRVAVRLGEHVVGEEEEGLQEIAVSRAVPHPHFSENPLNNDVAVVTLAKAARLDGDTPSLDTPVYLLSDQLISFPAGYVQPICVLLEGAPDPERMIGEKMFVAGWGRTHESQSISFSFNLWIESLKLHWPRTWPLLWTVLAFQRTFTLIYEGRARVWSKDEEFELDERGV